VPRASAGRCAGMHMIVEYCEAGRSRCFPLAPLAAPCLSFAQKAIVVSSEYCWWYSISEVGDNSRILKRVRLGEVPVPDRCAHQAGTSPPPLEILLVTWLVSVGGSLDYYELG